MAELGQCPVPSPGFQNGWRTGILHTRVGGSPRTKPLWWEGLDPLTLPSPERDAGSAADNWLGEGTWAPTAPGASPARKTEEAAFGANPRDRNLARVQNHQRKPKWFKSGSSSDGRLCRKCAAKVHSKAPLPALRADL